MFVVYGTPTPQKTNAYSIDRFNQQQMGIDVQ